MACIIRVFEMVCKKKIENFLKGLNYNPYFHIWCKVYTVNQIQCQVFTLKGLDPDTWFTLVCSKVFQVALQLDLNL